MAKEEEHDLKKPSRKREVTFFDLDQIKDVKGGAGKGTERDQKLPASGNSRPDNSKEH